MKQHKLKKDQLPEKSIDQKYIDEQEYTDKGTVFQEDPDVRNPEFIEEKGLNCTGEEETQEPDTDKPNL